MSKHCDSTQDNTVQYDYGVKKFKLKIRISPRKQFFSKTTVSCRGVRFTKKTVKKYLDSAILKGQ